MHAVVSQCVILAVDEAMKRNEKLTSANEKQEATIVALKKVCGKVLFHLQLYEAIFYYARGIMFSYCLSVFPSILEHLRICWSNVIFIVTLCSVETPFWPLFKTITQEQKGRLQPYFTFGQILNW